MASDNGIEGFFEGTEKLLEIWFSTSRIQNHQHDQPDLRDIERAHWDELLQHVHCEIISEKEDDNMRAYVLSESSMFVSKNRFILKTCGSTTLLHAIKPLLRLVEEVCGFDQVDDVFYSRRKFMRPELQAKPHQSFEAEVEYLDDLFEDGAAYCLGRINRDCWYLYTIDRIGVKEPDQTLEILMVDLDQSTMRTFTKCLYKTTDECTKKAKIDTLLPNTIIDACLFEPCGYSMNGILPNRETQQQRHKQGQYFTIHVTPEPDCSYVSFESNVPQDNYQDLITKVLGIFKPGKFMMTIFANKASVAQKAQMTLKRYDAFKGYKRTDSQMCQFKNYNLTYAHFVSEVPPAPDPI